MNNMVRRCDFEQFSTLHKCDYDKKLGECMILSENMRQYQRWCPVIVDAYVFVMCTGGSLEIMLNSVRYNIKKGMVFFYLPGDVISVACDDEECSVTYLVVSQDFIKKNFALSKMAMLLQRIKMCPQVSLSEVDWKEIQQMTECAKKCLSLAGLSEWSMRAAVSSVKMLFYSLLQQVKVLPERRGKRVDAKFSFRNEDIYGRFMQSVFVYCREKRSVGFYASKLFITSKHLTKVVKSITGRTASDWIEDVVIEEIEHELLSSSESISEIAFRLNFSNLSFFGKFFKRKTGVSPLTYRKMAQVGVS